MRRREPGVPRVKVVPVKNSPFWVMRWVDPATGKERQRSTGLDNIRRNKPKAQQMAGRLASELAAARDGDGREAADYMVYETAYREEHLAGLSEKSRALWETANGWVVATIKPSTLADVTHDGLARMVGMMRRGHRGDRAATGKKKPDKAARPLSETSIQSYLRTLAAAYTWAGRRGLFGPIKVPTMPRIPRGDRDNRARGRALTEPELVRMEEAAGQSEDPAEAFVYPPLMRLLFLSGLRLGEALTLSWDDTGAVSVVRAEGGWMFRFTAPGQKARRDEIVPMLPQCQAFLESLPGPREGLVLPVPHGESVASRRISSFGKAAGVIVRPDDGRTATAHDFRRSYATRLLSMAHLSPSDVRTLCRHASIETTLAYYHTPSAERLSQKLRGGESGSASGDTSGDTRSDSGGSSLSKDAGTSWPGTS